VEPFTDVNLGLTGDLDAVTSAHNLLAALVDNSLHHGNPLSLDPAGITWPRTLDMNDRPLRDIEIGRGPGNGPVRRASFVITPASEVTAILGLARGYPDLRERLGRILVGRDVKGRMVSASELGAAGPMSTLLRHAVHPNLLQTPEGAPVLVHGGPFGNLSYGTTTATSIEMAQSLADLVLVEAGFGTDLGAEKFVNLVSPIGGFTPTVAVLAVSIPVLRSHGGSDAPGTPLQPGLENLEQHIANLRAMRLGIVVALNRFPGDLKEEVDLVHSLGASLGVDVADSWGYARGGEGCEDLGRLVVEHAAKGGRAVPTYSPGSPLRSKIDTIVKVAYGGDGAEYLPDALQELDTPSWDQAGRVPVCMAKTPLSLTDDPKRLGRPRGFKVRIRSFVPAAGAGYVVALLGNIITMPGLPSEPRAASIDITDRGVVQGMS
jgi:formate--tetrahydrofolate ligase